MKLPTLRKYRSMGERLPRGYRVAWPDWQRNRDVCYPFGLHLILMLGRWLYHASYYERWDELDTLRVRCVRLAETIEYCCEMHRAIRLENDRLQKQFGPLEASNSFLMRCVEEETQDVIFVAVRRHADGSMYFPTPANDMAVCVTRAEAEKAFGFDKSFITPVSARGQLARMICHT